MDCSNFLDRYSEYDDSLLLPVEEARFRAHLHACEACARYDRVLRKGRMLARQVAADPSSDFLPRLQHRIVEDRTQPFASVAPATGGGFMTLMLVAVAGLWLSHARTSPLSGALAVPPSAPAAPAAEAVLRPLSLPPATRVASADWTTGRVDRGRAATYSPLVIGPPAYRGDRPVTTGPTSTTRNTLD
ncbi:MAG TPA: zf-HC2 domain-containing protein [Longimicrobiales bacterium]|nr:zf-HC2 domain-containing protein [Longimicrobiales bacterium]